MVDTFKIQTIERHRLTTDGKGVTTLVALLGCPLKCKYCINSNILSTGRFREYTPEKLLDEVMIDFCYFITTGGGITFGGGESLLHLKQILEFRKILPENVAINMETSMNKEINDEDFEALFNSVEQFIIDIKSLDTDIYKSYTGISNENVSKNLARICELGYQDKCRIRIPIIPDYKSEEVANNEAATIRKMGFSNVEVFPYVLRDYVLQN